MDDREAIIDRLVEQWQSLESEGRTISLADLCKDHPEFKDEVSARIDALRSLAPLLSLDHDAAIAEQSLPSHVGSCEVIEEIASSSSSVVYLALQRPTNRKVAVKVIHAARLNEESLARYKVEAKALGLLSHHGIASVYDAGIADVAGQDLPYLTMEFVDGLTLGEYLECENPDLQMRVSLLQQIAEALSHAHQRGVIHRDLKPSNIKVTRDGKPKILDFGIARLDHPDFETITRTGDGHRVLGTIPYMSPEQLAGKSSNLDVRTDIFSLGVIAYQAIAGELPFPTTRSTVPEAISIVGSTPAPLASSLESKARGDLETILGKALELEREHRYQSAREFADDLGAYLIGQPITAKSPNSLDRFIRWSKANKLVATLASVLLLTLAVGSTVASWLSIRNAGLTQVAQQRLEQIAEKSALADARLRDVERARYNVQLARASDFLNRDAANSLRLLNDNEACPDHLREFTWRLLLQSARRKKRIIEGEPVKTTQIAFDTEGPRLARGCENGIIELWNASSGELQATIKSDLKSISAIAFSLDSSLLAIGDTEHQVRLFRLDNNQCVASFHGQSSPTAVLRIPLGNNELYSIEQSGMLRVWRISDAKEIRTIDARGGSKPTSWLLGRNCQRAVVGCRGGEIRIINVVSGRVRNVKTNTRSIASLAFTPGDAMFYAANYEGLVGLWNWESGKMEHAIHGHTTAVWGLAASPRFDWFATCTKHRYIRIWETGKPLPVYQISRTKTSSRLLAMTYEVSHLAVSEDSQRMAIFDLTQTHESESILTSVSRLAFDDDGNVVGVSSSSVSKHDIAIREPPMSVAAETQLTDVTIGESAIYVSDVDGRITRRNLQSLAMEQQWQVHDNRIAALHYCPIRGKLFSCSHDGSLCSIDISSGTVERFEGVSDSRLNAVACSPDSKVVAAGGKDGSVTLFDIDSAEVFRSLHGHEGAIRSITFSPDGRQLATASEDNTIRIWDAVAGDSLKILKGHQGAVTTIDFSPDSKTLASAGYDMTVRLWDPISGIQRATLAGHVNRIRCVRFAPDGNTLLSSSKDNTVKTWRAAAPSVQSQ